MPVKKSVRKGVVGYKWGKTGKWYRGKTGKRKAARQGQAISWSKSLKKSKKR